jgi:hypothetical protein
MRICIVIIGLLIFNNAFSQNETFKVEMGNFDGVKVYVKNEIRKKDTLKTLYLSFQNARYKNVTDLGMFSYRKQKELNFLITGLSEAIERLNTEKIAKTNKDWVISKYSLTSQVGVAQNFDCVWFHDDDKYITISLDSAKRLLSKIQSIVL